jgi:hypothetical protein
MMTAKENHEKAMSLYEESLAAKYNASDKKRIELLRQAFKYERDAALLLKDKYELEPTRSKLFASSATMAHQLLDYRESEKMIAEGLSGNPPQDILEELRDLFDKVNFYRHLTTKGIELAGDEFRFTLGSGDEIMKGFAKGDEVLPRIVGIEALYSRTVQRMNKRPYKSQGRVSAEDDNIIQMYYQTPQAASFALIFKIPCLKSDPEFPSLETPLPYVDEMLQCIELVNKGKLKELKEKIADESYFQSFIINARKVAPDGKNVKQVGFTIYRNNEEKILPFDIKQSEIILENTIVVNITEDVKQEKRKKIIVSGTLLVSDTTKKFITIVEEIKQVTKKGIPKKSKFKRHKVTFSNEAQRELVRLYYEEYVSVEVFEYQNKHLEFIDLKPINSI